MCQGSLELHVLSHAVLGPLSYVTHVTVILLLLNVDVPFF